jgi:hypothetical protein
MDSSQAAILFLAKEKIYRATVKVSLRTSRDPDLSSTPVVLQALGTVVAVP